MKRLDKFKSFNEALGVATSTMFYLDRLTYICIEEFYKYIDKTRPLGPDSDNKDSVSVRLSYRDISSLVPSYKKNEYDNFPLSEILLTIDFTKRGENKIGGSGYLIGGYASPFAKGRERQATRFKDAIRQNVDHSLSIHMGVEMIYDSNFKKISFNFEQFERTHLFRKVKSVISHELNHLYEYYNRKIHGSKPIETSLTWSSIGDNIYDVPTSLFNFWQSEFTDYIYNTERHEINAQVQEAKTFVDLYTFEKFRKSKIWKSAKLMQKWSFEDFKTEFSKKSQNNGLNPDETLDKMKDMFCDEYIKLSKEWKENPSLNPEKLKRMSVNSFFEFFQKRFGEAGTKLARNYCRLYALKEIEK
jgi:predicted SprT family Zn-dependent metalloprotease